MHASCTGCLIKKTRIPVNSLFITVVFELVNLDKIILKILKHIKRLKECAIHGFLALTRRCRGLFVGWYIMVIPRQFLKHFNTCYYVRQVTTELAASKSSSANSMRPWRSKTFMFSGSLRSAALPHCTVAKKVGRLTVQTQPNLKMLTSRIGATKLAYTQKKLNEFSLRWV